MLSSTRNKLALLVLGTVIWSVTMVKSGLTYSYGMGFWGANGHDGIWHIALIESLSHGRFTMPMFSGNAIQNYHLGFDLLLAGIHIVTQIPTLNLYFQLLPPIFAFAIGYLTYQVIYFWTKSTVSAWWSTFFVYFGGSLGWLFGQGESLFWAQQSISTLVNPPFALSLVLLLLGLYGLQKNRFWLPLICFILLPQIKIYAGILAFFGLAAACLKNKKILPVLVISAAAAFLLFIPTNTKSAGLIVWQPLWFLDQLFTPDRFSWPRFYSALFNYRQSGIWLKAIPAYAIALGVFLFGNLGSRVLSVCILKDARRFDWLHYFFVSSALLGLVLPMLFIQTGTAWNTIQFFYYTQIFLGLLAGLVLGRLFTRPFPRLAKVVVVLAVLLLTLPTTHIALKNFLPARPPAKLSLQELAALKFLSTLPPGTVLSQPYDSGAAAAAQVNPPRPLRLYDSTAYISAFSDQPVFLEDEVNLNITGFNWTSRRRDSLDFFAAPSFPQSLAFLKTNHIRYIYTNSPENLSPYPDLFQVLFANSEAVVYQVAKL